MSGYAWVKQNKEPIQIEYRVFEDAYTTKLCDDMHPMFWFENEWHDLDDYSRCHDNPWIGYTDYPDYIHGFDCFDYSPDIKFVEIVDSDHLNVWREVRTEQ